MDVFQDEGSLCAVAGHRQAARMVYLGLHGLEHRGDAALGVGCSDGIGIRSVKAPSFAAFGKSGEQLEALRGRIAVGHVMGMAASEQGEAIKDVPMDQPLCVRWHGGQMCLAMAGRFTNGFQIRSQLQEQGAIFSAASDVEVLAHLIARSSRNTFVNRLVEALWEVKGAFCLTVCTENLMIAVRDPMGFRPLVMGYLGQSVLVATEDTVLRNFSCTGIREVAPGEMVIVDNNGVRIVYPFLKRPHVPCVEDIVQLARNDATVFGVDVYSARVKMGARLAKEQPCIDGTVVLGLPGAGVPAALGYAQKVKVPYHRGLEQPTQRRFIDPTVTGLLSTVNDLKVRVNKSVVRGEHVILVVPVLVTGKTVRNVTRLLRSSEAAAVHVRIAAPPVRFGSPYGVISPTTEELIYQRIPGPDAMSAWLGADSVGYLSMDGFQSTLNSVSQNPTGWCDTIFTGTLPIPVEEVDTQMDLFKSESTSEVVQPVAAGE